jgi:hypothetical protein
MIPFHRTHVPPKYADPLDLGWTLAPTDALTAATAWSRSGAALLAFAGPVGTGKSMAAAWALRDWWLATATVNPWGQRVPYDGRLWVAAPHLGRLAPWADEVQALDGADAPGMLVLDDLGEEEATPRSLAMLSSMLTSRFAQGCATIITTNLDGSTFRDRYGARLIDRLRECGLDERGKAKWWVTCGGESLRGRVEPQPAAAGKPSKILWLPPIPGLEVDGGAS